jgi:hypothetical protein
MKEVEMKDQMMVRTTEEIYNIQKIHWFDKIKSILQNRNTETNNSEIDRCINEDNFYVSNFDQNRFKELDKDLINIQSEGDLIKFRDFADIPDDKYDSYVENWKLYETNNEGYISPYMINWWFKHYRDELKKIVK